MALARIYSPARSATTSGAAKSGMWVLEYERDSPRTIEPLMGYTSSRDMMGQVRLSFATMEEAVAYAEREGVPYRVESLKAPRKHKRTYAENFSADRAAPWTH